MAEDTELQNLVVQHFAQLEAICKGAIKQLEDVLATIPQAQVNISNVCHKVHNPSYRFACEPSPPASTLPDYYVSEAEARRYSSAVHVSELCKWVDDSSCECGCEPCLRDHRTHTAVYRVREGSSVTFIRCSCGRKFWSTSSGNAEKQFTTHLGGATDRIQFMEGDKHYTRESPYDRIIAFCCATDDPCAKHGNTPK